MSTMDFFTGQARARRRTGVLVAGFTAAVIGIAVVVWLVIGAAAFSAESGSVMERGFLPWLLTRLDLFAVAFVGTLLVIGLGSLLKGLSLRAGGEKVATALGGRLVPANSRDPRERRLLNVVEEIAIASGTPVPPVYLLDGEEGINAFAAGHTTGDAVIGVTKGTLERLNRDELQGVVAHEFSHILNGDMRLNLRLIGWVHGIVLLGLIGYIALRIGAAVARASPRGGGKSKGGVAGAALGIMGLGLVLIILGYVGTFIGRLIKAAVSRQREFLADSASAQFTRNPAGIAGALKKIGGFASGSRVKSPRGEEVSHMFFSQGFVSALSALFATHPPLPERIRRLEPTFAGAFPRVDGLSPLDDEGAAGVSGLSTPAPMPTPAPAAAPAASTALQSAGRLDPAHLVMARQIAGAIPADLAEQAREPHGAQAVIYALLLNTEPAARGRQADRLGAGAEAGILRETWVVAPGVAALPRAARLPLAEIAVGGLRGLSLRQYREFRENLDALIAADEKTDLFEWALRQLVVRNLEPAFSGRAGGAIGNRPIADLSGEAATLLSVVARQGSTDAAAAFAAGAARLAGVPVALRPADPAGVAALDAILPALDALSPEAKRSLLSACAATISADRVVTEEEAELFRAVAAALGCPVPPLLPGQVLA